MRARGQENQTAVLRTIIAACNLIADEEGREQLELDEKSGKRGPYKKREPRWRLNDEGERVKFGPKDTPWYLWYVLQPDVDCFEFRKKFRRRFRCSYLSFQKHLAEVKESPLFKAWGDSAKDCIGNESSPIELLLLGVLRYIGRGWCFDDLEEQTCISEGTHRRFLHVYLHWASTTLYEKYVTLPASGEEARQWASEYAMAGFPGCIGSESVIFVFYLPVLCSPNLSRHGRNARWYAQVFFQAQAVQRVLETEDALPHLQHYRQSPSPNSVLDPGSPW